MECDTDNENPDNVLEDSLLLVDERLMFLNYFALLATLNRSVGGSDLQHVPESSVDGRCIRSEIGRESNHFRCY